MAQEQPAQRVVVHLGNLDCTPQNKTMRHANRFPRVEFIGIDRGELPDGIKLPGNWRQIRAEFSDGLRTLENESVHIISSEMAAGHGNSTHLAEFLRICHAKLRPNGKLHIVVAESVKDKLETALRHSPFPEFQVQPVPQPQSGRPARTYWMGEYQTSVPLYQFTVTKPISPSSR